MATPDLPGGVGVSSSWEPGTTVGRYTLLTTLAQGGMAEIWLARQGGVRGFEKLVVIKRMMNDLEGDPESVEMFLTEARLAAQLTHPNVVQIFELGEQGGSLYIVMEYLDGEDLAAIRRTGQKHGLPLLDHYAAKLISLAAEGLHYAHTRVGHDGKPLRIVHRDVSPQNLIATFDGGLKVVDFGIAKAVTEQTHSGKLKGKLGYMSPEQARGEQLDARSDVFSLGVVLFEVVTRTRLLPKMNDLDLLNTMAGSEPLPRAVERRPDLPPGLDAIVRKALERKRELRYQSARELQEALDAWTHEQGKAVSTSELADYLRTLFARRIHERRQLIETAMTAELTPSSTKHLHELATRSEASRSRTNATDSHVPGRGLKVALVAMGVIVLAIAGAVAMRVVRSGEPPASADAPMVARNGVAGNGVAGNGVAGNGVAGNGIAGNGVAGSGVAGNGVAGNGVAGNGVAGNGVAGNGVAGNGVAGNGVAGNGVAGNGVAGNGVADHAGAAGDGANNVAGDGIPGGERARAETPAAPPVLVVDTVPSGAELSIDGEPRGKAPLTLDGLAPGPHQLTAQLDGYQPASREVTSTAGERVVLEVALLQVPKPVGATKARPVARRAELQGKLTLKTTPWTTVYLGKKKLGDTPLINQVLPAGRHTLRLVSPETNTENSIEVEILANETTTKKLKL